MTHQPSDHDQPRIVRFFHHPRPELHQWMLRGWAFLQAHLAIAVSFMVVTIALLACRLIVGRVRARRLARAARIFRIGVPPEVDVGEAALFWAGLHDLLRPRWRRVLEGQPYISWEIHGGPDGTEFQLWLPHAIPPGLVERALASAYPGLTITERPAATELLRNGPVVACELVFSGPGWFPLGGHGSDPLRLVLGQLANIHDGYAIVQIVSRPATIRERGRLTTAARRIRAGAPTGRVGRLLGLFQPTPPRRPAADPTVAPDVRAVLEKASQPLFRAAIRIAVTAPTKAEARGRIHAVAGAFAAYEGRVGLRRRHLMRPVCKLAQRELGTRNFPLSVAELASLCHLPAEQSLPGLLRSGARTVAPPAGLPSVGKPLGIDSLGRPIALGVADARYHLHLVGPTGVGKSTLIARLALYDLQHGRGAVIVDPKGDLVEDILNRIPPGLEDRVDLLDPLDTAPPGLNVLEGDDPDLVVDQLVGIFQRVFERFWGPRTDDILRASLLTLIRANDQATLADVPRLLADDNWRKTVTAQLDDPVGLEPFWAWYAGLGDSMRAQATGPVLNKLRAFLLRRPVRAIVGQPASTIDVPSVLNDGRLLLVRVPKGTLGEDTSRLLGAFVVARVWQAALARAGRPENQRRDAGLYVDEVHNYVALPTPLADMLAEARGYRLSLSLAHQHLGQLPKEMREALSANARSKLYFQLSPEDAHSLQRLVEPDLGAHDLAHLPAFTAAARICHGGEAGPAFTLTTQPLPAPIAGRAEAVRVDSRRRNGTPVEQVDAALAGRHGRPAPASMQRERARHDRREVAR